MAGNSPKQSTLGVVAQYGCQNLAACVGKWPRSKVWNHLSSARVQKTTVVCLLQEPSLIDFIYTEPRGHRWWDAAARGGDILINFCFPGVLLSLGILAPLNEMAPL